MIRIHTPPSLRRHSASAAPSITGMVRNMRCSSTARWCTASNPPSSSTPHSAKSHVRSGGSDSGSMPRSVATTARKAAV